MKREGDCEQMGMPRVRGTSGEPTPGRVEFSSVTEKLSGVSAWTEGTFKKS